MVLDISGLDKAAVLVALYGAAKPQGMGFLHFNNAPLLRDAAAKLLEESQYFDYLHGRVMKVRLNSDQLRTYLYDRDNGAGAALRALQRAGLNAKQIEEVARDDD